MRTTRVFSDQGIGAILTLKKSKVFNIISNILMAPTFLVFGAAVLFYEEDTFWGFFEPIGLIGILAFGVLCGVVYLFAVALLIKIYSGIYDALKSKL
jgi:hypothetical protein